MTTLQNALRMYQERNRRLIRMYLEENRRLPQRDSRDFTMDVLCRCPRCGDEFIGIPRFEEHQAVCREKALP
jgi:hypothetical protein